jgi:hypothetical protein
MKRDLIELDAENQANSYRGYPRDVELECQMLQLLLNPKITSFSFPRNLFWCNQPAGDALWQSLLAEQPPDLHTIVSRSSLKYGTWNMKPLFDSMLPLFPNLEVIRLEHFECTDADLINIAAQYLPKIR